MGYVGKIPITCLWSSLKQQEPEVWNGFEKQPLHLREEGVVCRGLLSGLAHACTRSLSLWIWAKPVMWHCFPSVRLTASVFLWTPPFIFPGWTLGWGKSRGQSGIGQLLLIGHQGASGSLSKATHLINRYFLWCCVALWNISPNLGGMLPLMTLQPTWAQLQNWHLDLFIFCFQCQEQRILWLIKLIGDSSSVNISGSVDDWCACNLG